MSNLKFKADIIISGHVFFIKKARIYSDSIGFKFSDLKLNNKNYKFNGSDSTFIDKKGNIHSLTADSYVISGDAFFWIDDETKYNLKL